MYMGTVILLDSGTQENVAKKKDEVPGRNEACGNKIALKFKCWCLELHQQCYKI